VSLGQPLVQLAESVALSVAVAPIVSCSSHAAVDVVLHLSYLLKHFQHCHCHLYSQLQRKIRLSEANAVWKQ
jgi:hypothetical protein